MLRQLIVLVVAGCSMPGCVAPGMLTSSPRDLFIPFSSSQRKDSNDLPLVVSLDRDEIELGILPIGSYVGVDCKDGCKFQGILVRGNQNRVELANCLRSSPVVCDDGGPALATRYMPSHVIERPNATRVTILSLPSPKFDPPELKFEKEDAEVVAMEFHSGRIQRWMEPSIEAGFRRSDNSIDEMVQAMKDIQAGSQIAFLDSSGRRYNALLLRVTSQKLNLRCCVEKEAIQESNGNEQSWLNHLPICSFPVETISTLSVVARPPQDFDGSDFDSGCELCIADWIYKSGRRQSEWKSARDDKRMSEFFDKNVRPLMERKLANVSPQFSAYFRDRE